MSMDVLLIDPLLGVPARVKRPNKDKVTPYLADRAGLQVSYRPSLYLDEQPTSIWWDQIGVDGAPLLLRNRDALNTGECLTVVDDELHDIGVGTPLVLVEREATGQQGYITLDSLLTKMKAPDDVWAADDLPGLRKLVEFPSEFGILHSTNRVGVDEVISSRAYLSQFQGWKARWSRNPVHPLECGAHAHRIGCWALDEGRSPKDRNDIGKKLDMLMRNWVLPNMVEVMPGVLSWGYDFDFYMPWATKLSNPWFAGYANAALVGSAACAYALTGKVQYKEVAMGAFRFLCLPMEQGGALYQSDGFPYVAEYVYRSPPIPNYRVLDGELCTMPYLVNAAMLLDEPELAAFANRLNAGFLSALDLLADRDGAPYFGMDGQPMQPNYMWQLWMCLQLLAAIFKDRSYTKRARMWRSHIPESFVEDGYPF